MKLSYMKKFQNFFMARTMENLIFTKSSLKKSGRLLNFSQTVVDLYIFSQIVVYAHFGQFLPVNQKQKI